jgi:para-aminobenzoate synthetase component 1
VSTIEGRLRSDCDLANILRSILPGGTITGCPKVRTIEIIDSLEPCFRGPYTGSFGTIGDDGSIRLNLIIRALLILEDRCFAQAGGGIVVDSSPEYEYNENGVKARALLDLLR